LCSTLIFGDKRVRVWVVRIAQEGDYRGPFLLASSARKLLARRSVNL
jgi:hypothetical protein